jgi:hypothetical protein
MLEKRPLTYAYVIFSGFLSILILSSAYALDREVPEIEPFRLYMTKFFWANQEEPEEIRFGAKLRNHYNIFKMGLFSPKNKKIFTFDFHEQPLNVDENNERINNSTHSYSKTGSPSNMLQKFTFGDYTLLTHYYDHDSGKVKREKFIYSLNGPFPPLPVINYPENDQTDVELEPLIEWERTSDDSRFIRYDVEIRTGPRGEPSMNYVMSTWITDSEHTYFQIPADLFQPNVTYYVWVEVEYDGNIASENGIKFTTVDSP